MVLYKTIHSKWHKGTGGGSGFETEFENWDDIKYARYDINKDDYDHTDVANTPLLLLNIYAKSKEPFLTVIRL